MIILSIETSCDDTGVAVIQADEKQKSKIKILSHLISSQADVHREFGGVYPLMAKREHKKNLPLLVDKALKKSGKPDPDLIAVTAGPGLDPCLWVGANYAQAMGKERKVPVLPINHVEAHIYSPFIERDYDFEDIFPAVCLVASGGHTQLILVRSFGDYKLIGETRDDAAGECFDKIARMMGLEYPGGPVIEQKARAFHKRKKNITKIDLPRPMLHQKNLDFSFSGLKTAALYHYKSQDKKTRESASYIEALSFAVQQAVIDVLTEKTIKAATQYRVRSIIMGGGVTANNELRLQFAKKVKERLPDARLIIPKEEYSTDNAVMIGLTAYFLWLSGVKPQGLINVNPNLKLG